MEKRVTFNERWLPYLLVAPQIIITLVFFFWPSGQAIWQSVISEDAFGGNTKFIGSITSPISSAIRTTLPQCG